LARAYLDDPLLETELPLLVPDAAEPPALLEPAPALFDDGEDGADEPLAPLRLLCWSALVPPAPALSRWHAAMPTARMAAVSAAVMAFSLISSPLGLDEVHPHRSKVDA
jgi:hypothetical protein